MPKSLNYKAKIVKERRLNRKARIQIKKCAEHVHTHIYMYCAMIVRAGDNPNIGITAGIAISPVLVLLWCHRVSPSLWCVSTYRGEGVRRTPMVSWKTRSALMEMHAHIQWTHETSVDAHSATCTHSDHMRCRCMHNTHTLGTHTAHTYTQWTHKTSVDAHNTTHTHTQWACETSAGTHTQYIHWTHETSMHTHIHWTRIQHIHAHNERMRCRCTHTVDI